MYISYTSMYTFKTRIKVDFHLYHCLVEHNLLAYGGLFVVYSWMTGIKQDLQQLLFDLFVMDKKYLYFITLKKYNEDELNIYIY